MSDSRPQRLSQSAQLAADGGAVMLVPAIIWTAQQFGADMGPMVAGGFAVAICRVWSRFERWMER